MKVRLPDLIQKELDACGLPWTIENGGRHTKIMVAGRQVAVMSRGQPRSKSLDPRALLNKRMDIRHAIARLKEEAQCPPPKN